MKRTLLSVFAIGLLALTSCKKEEVATELGTATVKGNIYADLDYTNDVNSSGVYAEGSNPEAVEGMVVKATVSTYYWDQDPDSYSDYQEMTYTATTDANGDFTMEIPANDNPYTVTLEFADVYTTKTSYSAEGNTVTNDVEVSLGDVNVEVYKGASVTVNEEAYVNDVNSSYDYGTASVIVYIYANWDQSNGTTYDDLTGSPLVGKTLKAKYMSTYYTAPNLYGNEFTATITTDGYAIFEIPVVAASSGMTSTARIQYTMDEFVGSMVESGGTTVDGVYTTYYTSYNTDLEDGQIYTTTFYIYPTEL